MRLFLSLLLIWSFISVRAQVNKPDSCSCEKDFSFVANYLENHYSGFSLNITKENRAAYDDFKRQLSLKSKELKSKTQCLFLLKEFLEFFRDRHLQIRFGNSALQVDEKSEKEVQKFKTSSPFLERERIDYDSVKIWSCLAGSPDEVEGIYENEVYQIAVIQNQTDRRDYYGIITRSKTPLWEKGQVKLEIKKTSSRWQVVLYLRNHFPEVRIVESGNPIMVAMGDLKKVFPLQEISKTKLNYSVAPVGRWFQFKELNDSTTYLHIKTFNGALKSKFDSAYKKVLPIIARRGNLIIDIRNNGGGSDFCWAELEKYLYTQPYHNDLPETYCSSETIYRYEEWIARMEKNRKAYGWRTIKYMKIRLRKMKKATPGTFLPLKNIIPWYAKPFVNPDVTRFKKVHEMPRKVILMFNQNTASAAEGLILSAIQSKKVLTFGENSGGYIAFGDVTLVNTPSGFSLQSGTMRVSNRFQYEKIGIAPNVRANDQQDWIEQTNQLWKLIK